MPTPEQIRQQALETATVVEDALRSIAGSIQDVFEQTLAGVDQVAQTTARDLQSSFNRFAKITDDVSSNVTKIQQGLLKSKTVQDQITKRRIEELSIGTKLVTNLRMQGATGLQTIDDLVKRNAQGVLEVANAYHGLGVQEKSLVDQYIESVRYSDEYIEQLKLQTAEIERQEKALGNTGKLIQGLTKIPILGKLIDSEKVLAAAQKKAAEENSSKVKVMGAAFKSLASSVKEGLLDPLTVVSFIIKSITSASNKITDIQKSFGLTKEDARSVSLELERQAILSGDVFITSQKLNESLRQLSATLGFAADTSGQTLQTFTNLTQRLGFSNEEATRLTYLTRLQGENTEDILQNTSKNVVALNRAKGTSINIKDVFRDISTASAATTVSLGGNVDALAAASVKARQLGLSLSDVDQIASSLLDFQSSIENELAAELMTGKQLNLEGARYYALTNQTEKLTGEIANNQEVINAFASDNRLAQEAAAKAFGMSREDLGKMVMQQQFLTLGAEKFRDKFGEANYKQMQALSIGEKFEAVLVKIQETIGVLAYGLEPIADIFATLASSSTVLLTTLGAVVGLSFVKTIGSLAAMAAQLGIISAEAITTNAALTFGIGTIAVLAAIGAMMGAMQDAKKADDLFSEGGYGKRTLLTPEGAFALNDKDNIIATTNPVKADDLVSRPAGSVNTSSKGQQIAIAPSNTQININLDGASIGNANARQNYEIGRNIRAFGGQVDYSATV